MDLSKQIELNVASTENELTRVVWWDEDRLNEGVFTFAFDRCSLSKDESNFALINTTNSEKVVLWLVHHPSAKHPDWATEGEKVLKASIKAFGKEMSGHEVIDTLNECGGILTFNSNERIKWTVTISG